MPAQPLTYEGVLEMFRETRQLIKEQGAEFDRRFQETDRRFHETDRRFQETDQLLKRTEQAIGRLGNRIGDIIEHMVGGGNIVEQFQALDYAVTAYYRNKIFGKGTSDYGEIDLILEDGDVAILISVKTNLTTEDVHEHIKQLEKYRRHVDKKNNGDKCRFIGAVAGAVADQNVIDFAQKKGFYVIVQSGVAVEIVPMPEDFRAKEW